MNFDAIRKTVGKVLCIEAAIMLPPLLFALYDRDPAALRGFAAGILALLAVGLPCAFVKREGESIGSRDGGVAAALAWIIMSLFGAIPFYVSGTIPSLSGAVFETVSGFSTTGATILTDVESVSRAILLWRSLTNWLGGMGVLIFLLAIAPVAKEGGSMYLLRAEFPGPMASKLVPRMQNSAKLLYTIYITITALQILLLTLGRVPLFDAVNISLSTVSTGGFAVKNDSLMSYSMYAQAVTMLFMMFCSISLSVFYCLAVKSFLRIKRSQELRFYIVVVLAATLFIGIGAHRSFATVGEDGFHTLFQVISVMSTTAYFSVDPGLWSYSAWAILILLMITGPMAGSTGGGMKLSRVMILAKSTRRAISRTIVPNSTHLVHLDGETVDEETVEATNSFAVVYAMALVISAIVLSMEGVSFGDGVCLGISTLGNVGIGLDNSVLPMGVAGMSILGKAVLCFDMFLGRLEFFPLLVLFSPGTWRK